MSITRRRARLHDRPGGPDAPTIVILHGFPGSTFDWRHVVDDLAADHRVVGHDFVGFGLSDKPVDADYSLFTQADRTERVLQALDVERAVIVAHDVGDTVAAELLHRHARACCRSTSPVAC